MAFHSLCQSASREDSALALAREAVIRLLTDRPELGVVYDLSAVSATISGQSGCGFSRRSFRLLLVSCFPGTAEPSRSLAVPDLYPKLWSSGPGGLLA